MLVFVEIVITGGSPAHFVRDPSGAGFWIAGLPPVRCGSRYQLDTN